MASHKSSPLCAPPGLLLLLLLIGVIFTHRPRVHARPLSLCLPEVRETMMKRFVNQVGCSSSDKLPSSVRLCVALQPLEWEKKTLQEKRAEVLTSLQLFNEVVQTVRNQKMLTCLGALESTVRTYQATVKRIKIQGDLVTMSPSAVQNCSNKTSLNEVMEDFKRLLAGKLERFAVDLCQTTLDNQLLRTTGLGQ